MRKLLILFFTLESQGKAQRQTPSCSSVLLVKDLMGQKKLGSAGDRKVKIIIKSADQALITFWVKERAHVPFLLTFSHPWDLPMPFFCSEVLPSSVIRLPHLSVPSRLAVSMNRYPSLKEPQGSVMLCLNYSYKTCQFLCCVMLCSVSVLQKL